MRAKSGRAGYCARVQKSDEACMWTCSKILQVVWAGMIKRARFIILRNQSLRG